MQVSVKKDYIAGSSSPSFNINEREFHPEKKETEKKVKEAGAVISRFRHERKFSPSQDKTTESDMPYTAGASALILAPINLIDSAKSAKNAKTTTKDKETYIDAQLKASQAPFSFIYASGTITLAVLDIFSQLISKFAVSRFFVSTLSKVSFICGLIVSVIEVVIEAVNLFRAIAFSKLPIFSVKSYFKKLEKTKSNKYAQIKIINKAIKDLTAEKEKFIKKNGLIAYQQIHKSMCRYRTELSIFAAPNIQKHKAEMLHAHLSKFQETQLLPSAKKIESVISKEKSIYRKEATKIVTESQHKKLSKRIRPWAVNRLKQEMPSLIENLQSTHHYTRGKAIAKAEKLIDITQTQYRKKILLQIVGIVAISLSITGLLLSLLIFFNPLILPVSLILLPSALFWSGFSLGAVKYCSSRALLDCEGWNFKPSKILPKTPLWLKAYFEKIITSTKTKPHNMSYLHNKLQKSR